MRVRFWNMVSVVANLYKGGNGEKGPKIFQHLKRDWRYRPKEVTEAMQEYGFRTGKTPKGDYWVSEDSSYFPNPMKPPHDNKG